MSEIGVILEWLATRLAEHLRATVPEPRTEEPESAEDSTTGPAGAEDSTSARRAEAERWAAWLDQWAADHPGGPASAAPASPLSRLRDLTFLDPAELELVALAGMPDESSGFAGALRALHPRGEARPTVGLALALLGPRRDQGQLLRLLNGGNALRSAALELSGAGPFTERSLVLPDGLWAALRGLELPATARAVPIDGMLPGLEGWLATGQVHDAVIALQHPEPTVVLVLADDEAIALGRCAALASAAGRMPLARRCAPDDPLEVARLTVLATARGQVPVAVVFGPAVHEGPARGLDPSRATGPLIVAAPPGSLALTGPEPVIGLSIAPVSPADQRRAWEAVLPGTPTTPPTSRRGTPLTLPSPPSWPRISRGGSLTAPSAPPPWSPSRSGTGQRCPPGGGATQHATGRLGPPRPARRADRDRCTRRSPASRSSPSSWTTGAFAGPPGRDRGVRLLFTGPPGTGKTLAAEVLATALGIDLLTVDVSQVVSKWIGETEKNLGARVRRRRAHAGGAASSTRPTRSSATAPRSPTRTTATPTSRRPTCCSGWTASRGSRCSPPTCASNIDPAFTAADGLRRRVRPARRRRPRGPLGLHLPPEIRDPRRRPRRPRPAVRRSRWLDPQRRHRRCLPRRAARRPGHPVPPAHRAAPRVRQGQPHHAGRPSRGQALRGSARRPRRARHPGARRFVVEGVDMSSQSSPATIADDDREEIELPLWPFQDLRVASGMLLGTEDFHVILGNPRGKMRLHQSWQHGSGVVWGLPVSLDEKEGLLRVGSGLAVDGWGRELRVEQQQCLSIREWAKKWLERHLADPPDETSAPDRRPCGCRRAAEEDHDDHGHGHGDGTRTDGHGHHDYPRPEGRARPRGGSPATSAGARATRRASTSSCAPTSASTASSRRSPTRATPLAVRTRSRRVLELARVEIVDDPIAAVAPVSASAGPVRARPRQPVCHARRGGRRGGGPVAAAPTDRRAATLLAEVRCLAARDVTQTSPPDEAGTGRPGLFPVDLESVPVLLARLRLDVEKGGLCPPRDIDECVRRALLPTTTIQDLLCGDAPGVLGEDGAHDAGGRVWTAACCGTTTRNASPSG